MKKTSIILFSIFLLLITTSFVGEKSGNTIDLSGSWYVTLIKNLDTDESQGEWAKKEGLITLPASLAEHGFGFKTKGSDFGILTPTYKFIGIARYKREISIPREWKNKNISLFLERVLWESKVFIDGIRIDTQDALGTPHIHHLGKLKAGKHTLEIDVNNDMIHNIGDKGHAYSDYTQSIWNGIVGRIELQANDPTYISGVRTFSLIDKKEVKVELKINAAKSESVDIMFDIDELNGNTVVESKHSKKLNKGQNVIDILLDAKKLKKWNEFDPKVYVLKTKIKTSKYEDTKEIEFGYLSISHNGTNVLINNTPVFLRGNLDCVHFPLTGYASADMDDWMKIFKIYKAYGLNNVRYHSWCPPEAAFKAANRVGIYIQAEASIWIDWWMTADMKLKGRDYMDTKGHPKGLGKDAERDKFVVAEMNRVVDSYGNNPSFTMFCIGNELGNSDFDIMKGWVSDLKKKDPRRLYSVSTARKITDVDDYSVTHYISDVGGTRGGIKLHTDWDFEKVYSQMNIPIIAHEIGQWPVYPLWTEIDKYKGVLKARNLQEFKKLAEKNGVEDQDQAFHDASGALNQIMYKQEVESFFRTKSCAGIHLLSMQDYQGQGEALIGWLDPLWESKGITTPEKFREHFDETVPLLRFKSFVWKNSDVIEGKVQLSHYGKNPLKKGVMEGKITNANNDVLMEKEWDVKDISVGSLADIGTFSFPLNKIKVAQKLKISLNLKNTRFRNEWNVWVYPDEIKVPDTDVLVTDRVNKAALEALDEGKKVLVSATFLGSDKNSIPVSFYPLYWSYTFFPGQGKSTLGTLIKDQHQALKNFPTESHADWQWSSFKGTKGFILNDMPAKYKPIIQGVSDFHISDKVGIIFEFNVGKGKLLVSGYDIINTKSPVSKQLKYSLIQYMNSEDFAPTKDVSKEYIKELLYTRPDAKGMDKNETFENTILHIDAAKKAKKGVEPGKWNKNIDEIVIAKENTSYKAEIDGTIVDENSTVWYGSNYTLTIDCPSGFLGTLYVKFYGRGKTLRAGMLNFEGRELLLKDHKGNKDLWIKLHVMREDSNDGQLVFKAKPIKGQHLMISEVVLTKD